MHRYIRVIPLKTLIIYAESSVLETHTIKYSLFSRQDYHLDSLLSIEEEERLELSHHFYMITSSFQDYCLTIRLILPFCLPNSLGQDFKVEADYEGIEP